MAPLSEALTDAPGSLGTVRNAVLLLRLLAEGPAYQQLTDLADRSGLSLATVHRLLRSLVLADLVEQDPRSSRYGLGAELTRLSHRYLARLPILGAVAPYLTQVREGVGGTVQVELLVGTAIVGMDRVDGFNADPYRNSHHWRPALLEVGGRLLGARCPDERWKLLLAEVDEATRELADAEREHWAGAPWLSMISDIPGTAAEVAVPLVDGHGTALAALVAHLPSREGADPVAERLEASVAHLTRAAMAAGRTLGHG
ncbi:MAG: helix-turn-helix domain-containing protein [Candidatus Phosphoribacter sp.]|nr:helix-turn-helix domain-containing protein [Actinomycetales bacterium]